MFDSIRSRRDRRVSETAHEAAARIRETADIAEEQIRRTASDLHERSRHAGEDVQRAGERAGAVARDYVSEHPLASLTVAFGAGLLVSGILLRR